MAIFPHIELEDTVQVNDRTRIDATKSFVSKGEAAVTLVEIDVDGGGYVDVTGTTSDDWYTDVEFATAGTKTISVRLTTDGAPITETKDIEVLTAAVDALFSIDSDLQSHEADILKWIPVGRNTFLREHRRAQNLILDELARDRIYKRDGTALLKSDIVDILEVKEWSTFLTLTIIFQGISNAIDDVFAQKAVIYKTKAIDRKRSFLRADFSGDGIVNVTEGADMVSIRIVRR